MTAGIHAAGEHVAVIAICRDDLIGGTQRRLHPDHDRLLADIEVAEPANQPHAVELTRLLLEAPDQQHVAVEFLQPVSRDPIGRLATSFKSSFGVGGCRRFRARHIVSCRPRRSRSNQHAPYGKGRTFLASRIGYR
jgi:hypothetical protein